jgi:hypothetical protein
MLRIAIDRIDDLLDQASDVELEPDSGEQSGDLAEMLADDPAYRRLAETLAGLTTEELYELLALSVLARSDAAADEWPAVLAEARSAPEETLRDELARALLLSDEIETALERLGLSMPEEEAAGDEEYEVEEDDDDDDEEEEQADEEEEGDEEVNEDDDEALAIDEDEDE